VRAFREEGYEGQMRKGFIFLNKNDMHKGGKIASQGQKGVVEFSTYLGPCPGWHVLWCRLTPHEVMILYLSHNTGHLHQCMRGNLDIAKKPKGYCTVDSIHMIESRYMKDHSVSCN
jgi:hypothetical protein